MVNSLPGTNQGLAANLLAYDIGSTYTKAAAFRLEAGVLSFLGRAQAPTTLEDVQRGTQGAKGQLEALGICFGEETQCYATCSAAGGLRMVALGYMPRVTAKAAKEVAMTAGARVMEVISFEAPAAYREEVLQEIRPDIILLAGGTDGGDRESALENAEIIVKIRSKAKVIVACNVDAQAQVAGILQRGGVAYVRVANIMPTIHQLNIQPAREAIHTQFIKQITKAQGLTEFCWQLADQRVVPTPGAVLLASELLAKGTQAQEGVGGILLIDVGGATTDVHSALPELEKLALEERGLVINNEKQFSYRTVEGNLGLRVSATGIVEALGPLEVIRNMENPGQITRAQVQAYSAYLEGQTDAVPRNPQEMDLDRSLAACAITLALRRHAGHFAQEPDPVLGRAVGTAVGRDLRQVTKVLTVGGIFSHASQTQKQRILRQAFADPGISLLPESPEFYFDENYIMYAMGVLAQRYPDPVLNYMKNNIMRGSR